MTVAEFDAITLIPSRSGRDLAAIKNFCVFCSVFKIPSYIQMRGQFSSGAFSSEVMTR